MRIRVFLHYYFKVLIYNLVLTGITALIMASTHISMPGTTLSEINRTVLQLLIIFPTAGTAISIYIYHLFRKCEYPFYYNCGIRVPQLIGYTIILNIAVTLFILAVYSLIYSQVNL